LISELVEWFGCETVGTKYAMSYKRTEYHGFIIFVTHSQTVD